MRPYLVALLVVVGGCRDGHALAAPAGSCPGGHACPAEVPTVTMTMAELKDGASITFTVAAPYVDELRCQVVRLAADVTRQLKELDLAHVRARAENVTTGARLVLLGDGVSRAGARALARELYERMRMGACPLPDGPVPVAANPETQSVRDAGDSAQSLRREGSE